ncbi:MAG: SWIM zinc finger family protein [Saccharofermentanales bacterium]
MWDYYGYKPRKKKAKTDPLKQMAKLAKKFPDIQPVTIEGTKIAKTWWGIAWNKNLESYADYTNRIARGRSYVRSGAVIDLRVGTGFITAMVQGSRKTPYEITIQIKPLEQPKWDNIVQQSSHRIENMQILLEGRFPQEMAELFTAKGSGLFPSPKEIVFSCSCPDWAEMCKHVAAALYGIGARFDQDPTLLFKLRDIDFAVLLKKSIDDKMQSLLKNANRKTSRVIDDDKTEELFGI